MIEARALRRRFGDFDLGPLSLYVGKGEYCVLLGPSGCGKSMLLHTLAGIYRPSGGIVRIGGTDVTRRPPESRNVGLVFQQSALFPHMTVLANVEYGLRARGVDAAQRHKRAAEVVERVRIEPLLDKPVATLSGGEAQKVALARALAPDPDVLLLDEPLAPIDHDAREPLVSELERIQSELGVTALHVTHNRQEARRLGDHCAVLRGGRIVQAGPTDEVFAAPRCPFVARFLGVAEASRPAECKEACAHPPGRCEAPYHGP